MSAKTPGYSIFPTQNRVSSKVCARTLAPIIFKTHGHRRKLMREEDTRLYKVIINHEEQYSIWFADREPPLGWNEVGKTGTKQECLDYIKEVWTDMRPLSLRKKMEEQERKG